MHVYHHLLTACKLETRLTQAYKVCDLQCREVQSYGNLDDTGHEMLALLSGSESHLTSVETGCPVSQASLA